MTALMYHDVVSAGMEDSSGFPGRDAAVYKVTPERFEAHMAALTANAPAGADAITFDDGGVSALAAADILERFGRRGHFFITVNYISAPGFLDPAALRALDRRGHVVGSHSCSHPLRMGHLSAARLLEEWTTSRAALCDILGHDVQAASVPGGDFAPAVAAAAVEAGYTRLFTSEPVRRVHETGPLAIRGRFTINRWTGAATVAALAAGRWLPCTRHALLWNAKKIGKRIGGRRYLQARQRIFGSRAGVRWGDDLPTADARD